MVLVINELTKRKQSNFGLVRGIVYSDENYVEFGYFKPDHLMVKSTYKDFSYYDIRNNMHTINIFSRIQGKTLCFVEGDPLIDEHLNVFGNGYYPYSIEREYEAEKHIELFEEDDSLSLTQEIKYSFSDELKYSFGIEFETASGYISENNCFKLGLIPLRDGSISGIEYSTIPMKGNEGLCLLKRQLDELKSNTYTNKECSIHIHLGGYPVKPKAIFILHTLWYYIQHNICDYIPCYSYNTGAFKRNGKNYCNIIPPLENFKDLYSFYAEQPYVGSLYQPHPNDIEKRAKWNIKTRYFNCNFINMLCYNSAKTVEFRFLTPTYSFEKLTTFLLMFNGILKYAEAFYNKWKDQDDKIIFDNIGKMSDRGDLNILNVMKTVYSKDTFNILDKNFTKLRWLQQTQYNTGDLYGGRLDIENRYFPDGKQEN